MYQGIFTPMITAFDAEGKIDLTGNKKNINRLVESGVDGIVFLGSIGEFFNLSLEEKKNFIDLAVQTVNGRTKVLIGTGGTFVNEVVDLTKYAEKAGADAALVISPYYFKLDEENLYRFYSEVARNVQMDVMIYNFPDITSVNISPVLIMRLANDFKNIIGVKDTVNNISHTRMIINTIKPHIESFSILSGFDEYLVPNLLSGGDGMIGGLSNIAPELFVDQYAAFKNNDIQKLMADQKKVNILAEIYDISQPFISAIKAGVSIVTEGTILSIARKPASELTEKQLSEVRKKLEQAGII